MVHILNTFDTDLLTEIVYLYSACLLSLKNIEHVLTLKIYQYLSNKMQLYTVYLYLEIALHVSGGISTHHQERIQLYLQHLVFVTPLQLPAAIVEELEQLSIQLYALLMMSGGTTRNM